MLILAARRDLGVARKRLVLASLYALPVRCIDGSCDPKSISSVEGIVAPAWTPDGRNIFFFSGRSQIATYSVSPDGQTLSPIAWQRAVAPVGYDLRVYGAVSGGSQYMAAVKQAGEALSVLPEDRNVLGIVSRAGGRVEVLSVSRSTLAMFRRVTGEPERPVPISAAYLKDPYLAPSSRLGFGLYAEGYSEKGDGFGGLGLPYSKVFFDGLTGDPFGKFNQSQVRLTSRHWARQGGRLTAAVGKLRDGVIISVAANSATRELFALVRRARGELRILRVSPNSVESRAFDCGDLYGKLSAPVTVETRLVGPAEHQVALIRYTRDGNSRGTVFLLHGGPGGSASYFAHWNLVKAYLDQGFDVAAIDGSASLGVSLSVAKRIGNQGGEALERDGEIVASLIHSERERGRLTAVHAESFGASVILTKSYQSMRADLEILVVPWLRYRDPSLWIPEGGNLQGQRLAEDALLGSGREDGSFWDWQSRRVESWRPDSRTLVFFAERDPISRPEDLSPGFVPAQNVYLLKNAAHQTVYGAPEIWPAIYAHLAALSAPAETR
jgi:pimeloyl-ACP methyl ester carboxylesterase